MTLLDEHGQPTNKGLNWHRDFVKSVQSLLGLCKGLLADNVLTEQEIIFLDTWLKENEQITRAWPANVIADRLQAVLDDGIITQEEAEDLKSTLESILGGGLQDGAVDGMATRLPVQKIDTLEFEARLFCLTGRFVYGPRKKCERAIIDRGGVVHPRVVKNLHYLVIGTLASRDWVHTSHGRKIESAIKAKEGGGSITIVAEEDWVRFL